MPGPNGSEDIEALAFVVMMEAAKSTQEYLKEIMAEVKAMTNAKTKLRDLINKVNRDVAVEAGQRMLRIAKQSVYLGLGLSLGFMLIASLGWISPPIGALLQEVTDVIVILNALRAR